MVGKSRALTKWVIKVFASYNKQISERTRFSCELTNPDMTFMALEIEKIASYMGTKVQVTPNIINDMVTKVLKL